MNTNISSVYIFSLYFAAANIERGQRGHNTALLCSPGQTILKIEPGERMGVYQRQPGAGRNIVLEGGEI